LNNQPHVQGLLLNLLFFSEAAAVQLKIASSVHHPQDQTQKNHSSLFPLFSLAASTKQSFTITGVLSR
jgi:hypothetical protein